MCAGWREKFEVLGSSQTRCSSDITVLKEAAAGAEHWLVRPVLTKGCPER